MPTPIRLATTLLSFMLVSVGAHTQQPARSSSPPSTRAQADNRQIILDVVVTPKSGKPVTGLQQRDFSLLDNNAPQHITSFVAMANSQAPAEIVLLIDAVNTSYRNMAYERAQIDTFLKANGGHLAHPLSLAIFSDTGTQFQEQSSADGNQISSALDQSPTGLREIRRDSQYEGQDRFNLSLKTLQSLVSREAQRPGRKIIFWVSPGWPLLSGPYSDLDGRQQQQIYSQVVAISTMLRQNDITLYSIDPLGPGESVSEQFYYQEFLNGVKKPNNVQLGNLALQVIAIQSGGLALTAGNDIAVRLQQCMDDTTAYYRIAYEAPPPEHLNEYHRIDVRASTPGLTARTRTGYYAQP
jgi:VWFA-related protein